MFMKKIMVAAVCILVLTGIAVIVLYYPRPIPDNTGDASSSNTVISENTQTAPPLYTVNPDYKSAVSDTPTMMTVEEGLAIVRQKYSEISNDVKFTGCIQNQDKSAEALFYENDEAFFWVNSKTQQIDRFSLKNTNDTKDTAITLEKARENAKLAVQKYRPDYILSDMTETIGEILDRGTYQRYRFEWRQYQDSVDIGNSIVVELTAGGEFASYIAVKNDYQIDTKAERMTEEDAISHAKQYLSTLTTKNQYDALTVDKTGLAAYTGGRICWQVYFSSCPNAASDQAYHCYCVILDSQTGEIVDYLAG